MGVEYAVLFEGHHHASKAQHYHSHRLQGGNPIFKIIIMTPHRPHQKPDNHLRGAEL
jgi:hypothetical protein